MPAHQEYFEILGLDAPPTDRKAVKRAYSKMLKVTRPEDDPEGFMRLRDAHDQALDILKWQAEDTAWNPPLLPAASKAVKAAPPTAEADSDPQPETAGKETKTSPESAPDPGMTYGDMLPPPTPEPETVSETGYAIGPTPNFDAPVTLFEPPSPPAEPLIEDLNRILESPGRYNDREQWNILFRKARELDIDDYVDFEQLLMDTVLRFHGYFDEHPDHETPEKMPEKFSPSITASLFKTMHWDQVSKMGYIRGLQIEWLERRMKLRRHRVGSVPMPHTESGGNGKIWLFLLGAFIIARILITLAKS